MAAERVVETPRDQQALLGSGAAAERHPQQREHLRQARAQQVGGSRRAEHGGARRAVQRIGRLHEGSTAVIQPGSGTQPARRNISHGVRVLAAAAFSRAPSGAFELMKRQPAMSATSAVASREPASATITSPSRPAVAPGTSAASVGTSVRSDSWVAMMTLSMEPQGRWTGLHHIMWAFARTPHEIGPSMR